MTVVDVDGVKKWLERLPGGSESERHIELWNEFETNDRPVLTLFGSYDTGKSSLLRRLLVDCGSDVPSWLTISARHETFEVNEVEVGGYTVRDTPGFMVGASDPRGQNNTRRAMEAVGLTDVGVAVLTPQLATAERDVLQQLIKHGWPAGALWFIISRFDEAGVDPEYDLAEYEELRDRKVGELRELLDLDDGVPIFVVSQDPFQTAGPDSDLDREVWDGFRSWDGMAVLADRLEAADRSRLIELRHAAGQRHWTAVLNETMTGLREQLAEGRARAEVAASGVARRDAWESELGALDRAARASLEGLVEEVLRRSWEGLNPEDLQLDIQRSIDEWFENQDARLQRLERAIRKTKERERARPSWEGFVSLVDAVEAEREGSSTVAGPTAKAEHVSTVGAMLIGLLKAANKPPNSNTGKPNTNKAADKLGRRIGIAEAALPLAVYFADIADRQALNRARDAQDKASGAKRQQMVVVCTKHALEAWEPFVEEVRALIVSGTSDQVELDASLREVVTQIESALSEGEVLLRGNSPDEV